MKVCFRQENSGWRGRGDGDGEGASVPLFLEVKSAEPPTSDPLFRLDIPPERSPFLSLSWAMFQLPIADLLCSQRQANLSQAPNRGPPKLPPSSSAEHL